ncbi:DUF6443 domain-containing protein, partial [Chryseobacterium gossypii]|uniref:DUF6443 domain-containing protein n=1 Tax=Chryseobacterium gossypii TaxID=3231602 RepID=UPI0035264309
DGLGRLIQNVSVKVTPSGKDVVVPVEYDAYGRKLKSYLPIPQPASSNGAIYTNPLANVSATYGAEKIYSENIPEASPLGRPLSQKQVGNAWNTKPINFSYASNVLNEVKKYTVTTSWAEGRTINTLSLSGTYPANTLYKSTVTDEDGNVTIAFKNKKGQTVLLRKKEDSKDVDTYYIYNKY